MSRNAATTITASATVRVRGLNSPEAANAVASMLGEALGSALRSATMPPGDGQRVDLRPVGDRP